METKLILIEGIPGSGKSTIAKRLSEYLESKNIRTALFREGDIHPADLAWCSYVPVSEYRELVGKYPQHSKVINENTMIEGDYAIVAYTKLGFSPSENEIMKYFESYEVYDGKLSLESFSRIHLERWRKFAEKALKEDTVNIFECAFLQNHICELMGIHAEGKAQITDHFISLIGTVKKLKPVLIYLAQSDVNETISRVAKERISPDKGRCPDWIDLMLDWVEKSKYGKINGLTGYDGTIRFFETRQKLEMEIVEKLPIDKYIIANRDYDWDNIFYRIKEAFST